MHGAPAPQLGRHHLVTGLLLSEHCAISDRCHIRWYGRISTYEVYGIQCISSYIIVYSGSQSVIQCSIACDNRHKLSLP